MLGVIAVGAIKAILFAVVLELSRLIQILARPTIEVLGEVAGLAGFHPVSRHPNAVTAPELVILRFNGPLVFFNAAHFKTNVLQAVEAFRDKSVEVINPWGKGRYSFKYERSICLG